MKKTKIWMPLYVADYLADTTRLTTEQHGAYLLLIMDYWRNGPLPNDDAALAQITRLSLAAWKKNRCAVDKMFVVDGDLWRHKRVDTELADAEKHQSAKAVSGRAGAASKWGSPSEQMTKANRSERLAAARRLATHSPEQWQALVEVCGGACLKCQSTDIVKDHILPIYKGGSDGVENLQPLCRVCNAAKGPESEDLRPLGWNDALAKRLANAWRTPAPSPSPTPLKPKNITLVGSEAFEPGYAPPQAAGESVKASPAKDAYSAEFEAFWKTYPRKIGKLAAHKAYQRAVKLMGPDPHPRLLAGAAAYAKGCAGKDEQYVAHAQTWLNQGRWGDEPTAVVAKPSYVPMAANGG